LARVMTAEHTVAVPFDLSRGQDADFCRLVEEVVDYGPRNLHLDCSSLDPVHSSHIGLLWKAREICRQKSTEISLENTSDSLIRTLQALDLSDFFEISEACAQQPVMPALDPLPSQEGEQHAGDFRADAAGVDQGLREFMDLLERWRLGEETKFDLRTMFYEVATNIRCHSGLPADSRIQYRAACDESGLQLIFEDNGKPFDPLSLPDDFKPKVAARNCQTRGFGISLIRRLADDIEYTHKNHTTNVLSLTKRYGDG